MLTEEAHHIMIGVNGIARIIQRRLETMKRLNPSEPDRPRVAGVADLPMLQPYIDSGFSSSPDLFGELRRWHDDRLPSAAENVFVKSLVPPVAAPDETKSWIALPERDVNHLPADYDYIRLV